MEIQNILYNASILHLYKSSNEYEFIEMEKKITNEFKERFNIDVDIQVDYETDFTIYCYDKGDTSKKIILNIPEYHLLYN